MLKLKHHISRRSSDDNIDTPHIVFIVSNYPIHHLGSILIDTNQYLSIHELKNIKEECRFNQKRNEEEKGKLYCAFIRWSCAIVLATVLVDSTSLGG